LDEDPPVRLDPLPDWRVPYLNCLVRETLLVDKTEARWLTRSAKSFVVIEEELHKKSRTRVLHRLDRSHLRRVPMLCSVDPSASSNAQNNPYHMAICGLGA
jgi:hypothetical protein